MPVKLIAYKGIPVIFTHQFERIDNTVFIVVYKSGYTYLRKDFLELEEAIEFQANTELKLVFVCLFSKTDNTNYVDYRNLEFIDNKLVLSKIVQKTVNDIRLSIDFGINSFAIKKESLLKTPAIYYAKYLRTNPELEYYEKYYELIPRFEDIFLETIFLLDTMKENIHVSDKNEIAAYFLQSKMKIEEQQNIDDLKAEGSYEDNPTTEVTNEGSGSFIRSLKGLFSFKPE